LEQNIDNKLNSNSFERLRIRQTVIADILLLTFGKF